MKRIIVLGGLAVAALASVALLGVVSNLQPARSAGCSNSTLRGTYGFVGDGVSINVGPVAVVGTDTFDGAGHDSLDGMGSFNGQVSHFSSPGTYAVNADCTGTIEYSLAKGISRHVIVIVDDGRQILWMSTGNPNFPSGVTWQGIKKKI